MIEELGTPIPDCASLHPGYGVCKNSGAKARRENDGAYPPPHAVRERGTMRSMVEGAC